MSFLMDCNVLAPKLRDDDVLELQAGSGKAPVDALRDSVSKSKAAFTVIHEGEVAAMFGVGTWPGKPSVGIPWLLGSPLIGKFQRQFIRQSLDYVNLFQSWYPVLMNMVDDRYTKAKSWLEWCGFEAYDRFEKFGVEKRPFIQYVRFRYV